MADKSVLLALLALTSAIIASPVRGSLGDPCDDKAVNDECMVPGLDSLGFGIDGTCKEVEVSQPSLAEDIRTNIC